MEIPEHYRNAVIAHVMVDGAAEAITFYGAVWTRARPATDRA
nr:hypothetical protein [Streptomyces sp. TLI_235]